MRIAGGLETKGVVHFGFDIWSVFVIVPRASVRIVGVHGIGIFTSVRWCGSGCESLKGNVFLCFGILGRHLGVGGGGMMR